ncbi:MAG TPA: carotenoid oxygenase family protein, partial [Candidatus Dormibacteraeota bacterium]|nr:carotenoid oxygenase family protein [Candidatus Dormibacteraeota bacterium]
LFQNVSQGGPVRMRIDLKSRELAERIALNYSQSPDFPAIAPHHVMQPYDEFWMLGISAAGNPGRKFFNQLVHLSWSESDSKDIYQSPPTRYLGGEPVFTGAPDSDEGIVICQEFDILDNRSSFLIFHGKNVSSGPIARITLHQLLYLGFHAVFKAH